MTDSPTIDPALVDPDASKVVRRLLRAHHAAFLVGGCVRDLLLGRRPKDFDVATSATPNEIKDLFRNCRIIGRRFRLAHIFFGQKVIETATFRANPRGEDEASEEADDLLIKRDNVFGTAEEDAMRRDFTMNGLFYDLAEEQVIDYVDGLSDIEARRVRTIGDPDIRFREDPVRILRAIKFAARLGFSIEAETYRFMLGHRAEISKCAAPRVLEEVYRLLRGGAARRSVELLIETGVLGVLVPELDRLMSGGQAPEAPGDEGVPVAPAKPTGEVATRLFAMLDALDAFIAEHGQTPDLPSNAVLLGALLLPALPPPPPGELPDREGLDELEALLIRLLERLRVSRRDAERTRQALLMQRRLGPAKRRRTRPSALAARDGFDDALLLYELYQRATGGPLDEVERWRRFQRDGIETFVEQAGGQPGGEPGEASMDPTTGDRKKRRRRRGGRRRKKPGLSAGGSNEGGAAAGPALLDG